MPKFDSCTKYCKCIHVVWRSCSTSKVSMYLLYTVEHAQFLYFPSVQNYCTSLPCLNGGTCTNGASSFSCSCLNGYSGRYCQDEGKLHVIFILL